MGLARAQALGLRALRHLGRRRERRPSALAAAVAAATRTAALTAGAVAAPATAVTTRAVATTLTIAPRPVAAGPVAAGPVAAGGRSRRGRSPRSPRSGRSPRSRRARVSTTGWNSRSIGSSSSRPLGSCFSRPCTTFSTVMPSISCSTSTFSTSPTLAPAGRIDPARTPFGCLAPAARQVQVPSSSELVSSMSIRRDMVRNGTVSEPGHTIVTRSGACARCRCTVCARAHLRPRHRRSPTSIRPPTSTPMRSSSARSRSGRELDLAGSGAPRRRGRDHHRRPHEHPGQLRAAHDRRGLDTASATAA